MDPTTLLALISSLGLLGGLGYAIKAVLDRRGLSAKARSDDASAASVVASAARELIDPLRAELAREREDHAVELERERIKHALQLEEEQHRVEEVRHELDGALLDVQHLREEVTTALAEVARSKAIIRAQEQDLLDIREENRQLRRRLGV